MTQNIDAARLSLMLNDLRLPAIKQDWPGFAERGRTRKAGLRRACWPHWPSTRSPSGTADVSRAISPRPSCCPARHLIASTSTPCR